MNREDTGQAIATPHRRTGEYLQTFFAEKALESRTYEVTHQGTLHLIDLEIVIETICGLPSGAERTKIAEMIHRLDFANADIHHFLEHMAGALAANYGAGQ